jgi:hypothetical protein
MAQWIDEMYLHEEREELKAIKEQKSKQLNLNTMTKKSVVKHVQSAGTWNGMFKFEVEFENNDSGTCFCKEESTIQKNFPIGKEVEYEISPMGKGHKVKAVYNPTSTGGNGGGGSKSFAKSPEEQSRIARMNALTNAVNWAVSKGSATELDVLTIASAFENFIMNGLNTTTTSTTNNEDLPF